MKLLTLDARRYDTNRSGQLERNQLMCLLTELNNGVHPSEEEVDMIMNQADGYVRCPQHILLVIIGVS